MEVAFHPVGVDDIDQIRLHFDLLGQRFPCCALEFFGCQIQQPAHVIGTQLQFALAVVRQPILPDRHILQNLVIGGIANHRQDLREAGGFAKIQHREGGEFHQVCRQGGDKGLHGAGVHTHDAMQQGLDLVFHNAKPVEGLAIQLLELAEFQIPFKQIPPQDHFQVASVNSGSIDVGQSLAVLRIAL